MNPEEKRQSDPAKPGINVLDPLLEALRIEGAHIAGQDRVNELADCFALLLGAGMHQDHASYLAGRVPNQRRVEDYEARREEM